MRLLLPLAAVTLFAVGCGEPAPAPVPQPKPGNASVDLKPELKQITVKELDEFITSQKGKVVLIDRWFNGCAPCKAKFPHFVKLHQKYAENGLVCVSLNSEMDEWKDEKASMEEFLTQQDARFRNWIFQDGKKVVSDWLDKNDANATPSYVAWGRDGRLVKMPELSDQKDPEFVDKFVADLLAEK